MSALPSACIAPRRNRQQLPLACGLKPAMKIGASRLFSGELPLACGLKPAMKIGASRLFSGGYRNRWQWPNGALLMNLELLKAGFPAVVLPVSECLRYYEAQ